MTDNRHKRGFASMTPEKRTEIARKGGLAIRPENRSFSQDRTLASEAGRKGGMRKPTKEKPVGRTD